MTRTISNMAPTKLISNLIRLKLRRPERKILVLALGALAWLSGCKQPSRLLLSFDGVPLDDLGSEVINNPSNGPGSGDDSVSPGIGPTEDESSGASAVQAEDTAGGLVFLHNGELIQRAVDLAIPGRGFHWTMDRTYRSGLNFEGPLGHNWEFSYNRRLSVQANGDIIRMDGYGRSDRYTLTTNGFLAPAGFFTQLTRNTDGTFSERDTAARLTILR